MMSSVRSLTKNFIKDFVQPGNVGDFPLVHSDFFIKNPHLLKGRKQKQDKRRETQEIKCKRIFYSELLVGHPVTLNSGKMNCHITQ